MMYSNSYLQNVPQHLKSNDDSTGVKLVKSATIKLETAQGQLDKARERADKAFERDMDVGRKIQEEIRALAKFDATLGAKYLGVFSSRSLKTREKCISFAQFVYFLREGCLLFNF